MSQKAWQISMYRSGSAALRMERRPRDWVLLHSFAILCLSSLLSHCGARGPSKQPVHAHSRNVRTVDHWYAGSSPDGLYSYVGSPFTLPPYDDVMGSPTPPSSPQHDPVYCIYPPSQPPPATAPPSPTTVLLYSSPPPPPPSPSYSAPSTPNPNPPPNPTPPHNPRPSTPSTAPSPPGPIGNPPIIVNPSPPTPPSSNPPIIVNPSPPTPPSSNPRGPPQFAPAPPVFQPPVVYPPPSAPPPPPSMPGSNYGLWCVAKPSVPDPIIQEAMNYACGSGADCDSIQPNGLCYEPNTLIAHASFAFNSYWQRTKVVGGTCDFGGTAMLVTRDPSFDGCHFQHA